MLRLIFGQSFILGSAPRRWGAGPLCLYAGQEEGLQASLCAVAADKRGAWSEKDMPFCDVVFVKPKAVRTGPSPMCIPENPSMSSGHAVHPELYTEHVN